MVESQYRLLVQVRDFSRAGVLIGLLLLNEFSINLTNLTMSAQVAIALLALTIGIPHGAVDHLLAVPRFFSSKMVVFLVGYLAVAGLAIWLMLLFPLTGFQIIVLLSAIHFGIGDASFYMELFRRAEVSGLPRIVYALAAGSTPVLIPLVSKDTTAALTTVNLALVNWVGHYSHSLLILCILVNLTGTIWLVVKKFYAPAIDLLILLAVALFAPPLIAFALYFGLWHAMRHTARLTLEYVPAIKKHEVGKSAESFWIAVRAGLPAVAIVMGFTVWLVVSHVQFSGSSLLWYLLIVIWALTIPHMALTARSDRKSLAVVKQN